MAMMPGARVVGPTPNRSPGGMGPIRGLILHIQAGSQAGSLAWCMNPRSQVSAHFFSGKTGDLAQMVDTADRAWHAMAANYNWIGLENEGFSGDALTAAQIENAAKILAWLNKTAGVPIQSTDDPSVPGLGWHSMASDWGRYGGSCPGRAILDQRPKILERARQIAGVPSTGDDDMDPSSPIKYSTNVGGYFDRTGGAGFGARMVSDFPEGVTASLEQTVSWANMRAGAAYLKATEMDAKFDALAAIVARIAAKLDA